MNSVYRLVGINPNDKLQSEYAVARDGDNFELRLPPHVLEDDEHVEHLSLGAGNTRCPFDLETDRRVAEFKFVNWRAGPESICQTRYSKSSS
jgi:hypothetical protein